MVKLSNVSKLVIIFLALVASGNFCIFIFSFPFAILSLLFFLASYALFWMIILSILDIRDNPDWAIVRNKENML